MEKNKEYTRQERLEGLKAIVAFLEANPQFDLPECIEHGLVRTLTRTNRGQLQDRESRAEWFLKHVELLQPDEVKDGTDFYAIKYFGGGAKIVVELGIHEVAETNTEQQIVQRPTVITETTWRVPERLAQAGFKPDQEALRKEQELLNRMLCPDSAVV